jgi:hypothetical protein
MPRISQSSTGRPRQKCIAGITLSFFRKSSAEAHLRGLTGRLEILKIEEVECQEPSCVVSWRLIVAYTSHGACLSDIALLTQAPPDDRSRCDGKGYRLLQRDLVKLEVVKC